MAVQPHADERELCSADLVIEMLVDAAGECGEHPGAREDLTPVTTKVVGDRLRDAQRAMEDPEAIDSTGPHNTQAMAALLLAQAEDTLSPGR